MVVEMAKVKILKSQPPKVKASADPTIIPDNDKGSVLNLNAPIHAFIFITLQIYK